MFCLCRLKQNLYGIILALIYCFWSKCFLCIANYKIEFILNIWRLNIKRTCTKKNLHGRKPFQGRFPSIKLFGSCVRVSSVVVVFLFHVFSLAAFVQSYPLWLLPSFSYVCSFSQAATLLVWSRSLTCGRTPLFLKNCNWFQSYDGTKLAAGAIDGIISIIDLPTKKILPLEG